MRHLIGSILKLKQNNEDVMLTLYVVDNIGSRTNSTGLNKTLVYNNQI